MKLYAANCTHQIQDINFKMLDARPRSFATQSIDVGRQIQVAGEMNRPQIDYIIDQQTPYGWHAIADLEENRYVPIVYSVDKPVPASIMEQVIATNRRLLKDLGSRLRREAAIATSHGIRAYSPNAADNLSMSVEEEKQGTMDHGGDAPLAEGFKMTADLGVR